MDLLQSYNTVNEILDTVDFSTLFEGFHRYKLALYTDKEIVIDGNTIPYQDEFRGNTAIAHNGEYIAIWSMALDPVEDEQKLAYCLVHEMFHCHQYANNETRFPSDLEMLSYPDDIENFAKKYTENRYLADACEQHSMEYLRKFACIREGRYEKYPAMVCQEFKVETVEGMAEYIGLKALEQINAEKYRAVVNDYLGKLRAESNLIFDVRRMSYYTGAVFFLCLEQLGFSISNDFRSGKMAYEQNHIDFTGVTAEALSCDFISRSYPQLLKEKKSKIEEHIKRSEYIASDAFICGYDPMNMFRVGDMIYCSSFVLLNENGNVKAINSAAALKLKDGSDQSVVGYYL